MFPVLDEASRLQCFANDVPEEHADLSEMLLLLAAASSTRILQELKPWLSDALSKLQLHGHCDADAPLSRHVADAAADIAELSYFATTCQGERLKTALKARVDEIKDMMVVMKRHNDLPMVVRDWLECDADCAEMAKLAACCASNKVKQEIGNWQHQSLELRNRLEDEIKYSPKLTQSVDKHIKHRSAAITSKETIGEGAEYEMGSAPNHNHVEVKTEEDHHGFNAANDPELAQQQDHRDVACEGTCVNPTGSTQTVPTRLEMSLAGLPEADADLCEMAKLLEGNRSTRLLQEFESWFSNSLESRNCGHQDLGMAMSNFVADVAADIAELSNFATLCQCDRLKSELERSLNAQNQRMIALQRLRDRVKAEIKDVPDAVLEPRKAHDHLKNEARGSPDPANFATNDEQRGASAAKTSTAEDANEPPSEDKTQAAEDAKEEDVRRMEYQYFGPMAKEFERLRGMPDGVERKARTEEIAMKAVALLSQNGKMLSQEGESDTDE